MEFDNLETFGNTYLEINELTLKNDCRCKLSMITFSFNLDEDNIDIDEFSKKFKMENVFIKPSKQRSKTPTLKNDFFFNQITLEYQTMSKKSIKIFKNGKIHVTGLSSLHDCKFVTSLVCDWLELVFSKKFCVVHHSQRFDLINCTLDLNTSLYFKVFLEVLADFNLQFIYHPDIYSAIKVNLGQTKLMIFKTGSVILSSKESILRVKDALTHFMPVINEYKTQITIRKLSSEKLPENFYKNPYQDFEFCNGYSLKDLLAARTDQLDD